MADLLHAGGVTSTTFAGYGTLFAGEEPEPVARKVTLVTGQNLARGALVGLITASGKYALALSASSDGSQAPVAVLANDTDATSADKECIIYEMGCFNENRIVLGTGITLTAALRQTLRGLGLHFKKNLEP